MHTNTEFALKLKNVTYKYPQTNFLVLDDVNFTLPEKSIVALLGPNGAGKSTIIKAVLGLIKTEGKIEIFGESVNTASAQVGYVPQRYSFNTAIPITVKEFLTLALVHLNLNSKQIENSVERVLKQVDLKDYKDRLLSNLSGGQLQRILIARSLIHKPKLLLLDEPEAGIDVNSENSLYSLLKTLRDEFGMTIIIASHELDVVYDFADEVVCINRKLICSGKPKSVMNDQTFKSMYGNEVTFYSHAHAHK